MFSDSILNIDLIKRASSKYPKDPAFTYQYGTAGFRYKNEVMDSVMLRVGILSAFRSKCLGGKTIGVMITASHNQENDNGVKIVDPMGEMLDSDWETFATELANAPTDQVAACCSRIISKVKLDFGNDSNVIFARDTRPSGQRLVRALIEGLSSIGGKWVDFGELTTPQLHYLVRCHNTKSLPLPYGLPTEIGYYEKLSKAFRELMSGVGSVTKVSVDCANGVGALKLQEMIKYLKDDIISFNLLNSEVRASGKLNCKCGADFVKVEQKIPDGVSEMISKGKCCSFDGDADRIVYFFTNEHDKFVLLDGDKIAALVAGFIKDLLIKIGIDNQVEVGVVQTAYANGSSTRYFQSQGIPVAFTPTGVKYLHHRAEEFDIGVYFEANGHGTILFSQKTRSILNGMFETASVSEPQRVAIKRLSSLIDLVNETVGDAISDMLVVEAILAHRKWSLQDWATELYQDLPSRQLKVYVADRNSFKTTDADRILLEPAGLQSVIDEWKGKYENGRAFVRPSGTEDVVRVYAEAKTQEMADDLAYGIAKEVFQRAGGVGQCPVRP